MLTAVPAVFAPFMSCSKGTSNGERLAQKAIEQNNTLGIIAFVMLKQMQIRIVVNTNNVFAAANRRNMVLLLKKLLLIKAIIEPAKAYKAPIIDRTVAACIIGIEQKSSKNFFPMQV